MTTLPLSVTTTRVTVLVSAVLLSAVWDSSSAFAAVSTVWYVILTELLPPFREESEVKAMVSSLPSSFEASASSLPPVMEIALDRSESASVMPSGRTSVRVNTLP